MLALYWFAALVWTAPELLRKEEAIPVNGSAEGDVYSYAIILQEVMLKDFPYAANEPPVEASGT